LILSLKMNLMNLDLENKVIEALKKVFDPEIPVNIYDLGLIYDLKISEDHDVTIRMTLTAPNCPVAEDMPNIVREAVKSVDSVREVSVDIVFEPPWDKEMISESGLIELGLL